MRHLLTSMFLIFVMFILSDCALLIQEAPGWIDSSHLSCIANPKIVDNDLNTETVLYIVPGVKRGGAGVLIKLSEPTYTKHIEIYTTSRISDVRIYVAAEEPEGSADIAFEPIRYYTKDGDVIDRGGMKRFKIGREIVYLKVVTRSIVDYSNGKIAKSTELGADRVIPMVGPVVREIKFYSIGTGSI